MFYAHYVLSKKGPLARIWLAAHWDKKLTRNHVFDTNISSSVEAILQPQVKLALRTSGHLLLGVVRIYSRQAKYLLADCNEAFVKIKMAFRPGMESSTHVTSGACDDVLAAITLQENMRDFESTLADLNDVGDTHQIAMNQSRVEDITMREEFGEVNLGRPDDDFGDSNFVVDPNDGKMAVGDNLMDVDTVPGRHDDDDDEVNDDDAVVSGLVAHEDFVSGRNFGDMPPSVSIFNNQANDDEFGDANDADDDYDSDDNIGVMSTTGHDVENDTPSGDIDDSMFHNTHTSGSIHGHPQSDSRLMDSTAVTGIAEEQQLEQQSSLSMVLEETSPKNTILPPKSINVTLPLQTHATVTTNTVAAKKGPVINTTASGDFVLPPLRDLRQENRRGPKRKLRKLIIDEHKSIPSDVMKLQMQDTSEITTRLDLAPPTRKLMQWKETGTAEYLLSHPGRNIPSAALQRLFFRNMKTRPIPNNTPHGLPILKNYKSKRYLAAIAASSQLNDQFNQTSPSLHQQHSDDENNNPHSNYAPHHDDDDDMDYPVDAVPEGPVGAAVTAMEGAPGGCSEYSGMFDASFTPHPTPRNHQGTSLGTGSVHGEEMLHTAETDLQVPHSQITQLGEFIPGESVDDKNDQLSTIAEEMSSQYNLDDDIEKRRQTFGQSMLQNNTDLSTLMDPRDSLDVSLMSSAVGAVPDAKQQLLQSAIETLDNRMDNFDREMREEHQELTIEKLEKRSEIMSSVLRTAFDSGKQSMVFQDLTVSNNKKQAASKFYTLLLLGKSKVLRLKQESAFSNIIIEPYNSVAGGGGSTTHMSSDNPSSVEQDLTQDATTMDFQDESDLVVPTRIHTNVVDSFSDDDDDDDDVSFTQTPGMYHIAGSTPLH